VQRIDALIDGERRARVLADLAKGTLRSAGKQADLSLALGARVADHHAMLCRLHRDQIKLHDHAISGLDGQIARRAGRWPRKLGLLKSVPGFGDVVSAAWLAKIWPEPHRWSPPRQARLLGDLVPGEQRQRPQAQVRPDR
jgi:transposase